MNEPVQIKIDYCQIVGEPRDGPDGHAVGDEHDGHAALACRQVERDAAGC